MSKYIEDLQSRLKNVILNTCNTIGCDNCDLRWDGGCSALDLQDKIADEEILKEKEDASV